ncbi:uncharacterized aarF domain-containing protein kinase 1 [Copidosoma floridanum]|uniref:uncharacterized aarF domain-containing protein kinase 1 n=1 Tax=Copidosoma floridanum TaxID=29053 RepID=UPI0006C956E3|nr:uncharacterized aarF domain-containing protein kinase 1 [Copidosoma floridanum]
MTMLRRTLKIFCVSAVGLGTFASFRANEYDVSSTGIMRLYRASITIFDIGRYYKSHLYKNGLDPNSNEYFAKKSDAHAYGAKKLLELCCANKGIYIKVGQHIGALDYLLPKEYVHTMRILHKSAPESSFSDVLAVLKEDLKKDPYDIFESIEKEPLGAASLAQVHRAVLKGGQQVAVKVQHRAVKTNSFVDIKTMAALVKITSWIFPEFKFDWLVAETKKNLPKELDFIKEGENAEKVKKLFSQYTWLHIPEIFWNLSSSRVLTMEYIEGGQINDLEYYKDHNINPYEVANKLGQLYSHMIFITGFVHSDPHPGNILIRKRKTKTELVLLDHGLYAELSDQFRWEYSNLWLSILNKDRVAMRNYCNNLGVGSMFELLVCMISGRSWETIVGGVQKKMYTSSELDLFYKEMPNLIPKMIEVLQRVNSHMLLILKTNDLIRSIEYTLKTHARMSAFVQMSSCCVKSIYAEKKRHCSTKYSKLIMTMEEHWSLLKIFLYYTYLSIINFDFKSGLL